MSHRVSIYCPFCHRHTSLRCATTSASYLGDRFTVEAVTRDPRGREWWIGICNYCNSPVLVEENGSHIYPTPLPSPSDERIPENLRKDLNEAKMCCSTKCYRASGVLSRRCVQQACLSMGAGKDDLIKQIAELANKGILTKDLAEWATLVRWIGNDAAHPDSPEVSQEEAEDCLKLAEQFLHVLFVTPAIAEERKKKRDRAKK